MRRTRCIVLEIRNAARYTCSVLRKRVVRWRSRQRATRRADTVCDIRRRAMHGLDGHVAQSVWRGRHMRGGLERAARGHVLQNVACAQYALCDHMRMCTYKVFVRNQCDPNEPAPKTEHASHTCVPLSSSCAPRLSKRTCTSESGVVARPRAEGDERRRMHGGAHTRKRVHL